MLLWVQIKKGKKVLGERFIYPYGDLDKLTEVISILNDEYGDEATHWLIRHYNSDGELTWTVRGDIRRDV